MADLFETLRAGAEFSPCRKYRYALWRIWDADLPCVVYVGLNPSKANESENDMTITKEIGFARRWNFGGIYKLNLYGFCSTDPMGMVAAEDPVGPGNDEAFASYAARAALVVAAWGSVPIRYRPRIAWKSRIAAAMQAINSPVYCLGKTQDGEPRHTSRLAYDTPREPYWMPGV